MSNQTHLPRCACALLAAIGSSLACAQEPLNWLDLSGEYMLPARGERQLDTSSLHILFGKGVPSGRLRYSLGATLTHAQGDVLLDSPGGKLRYDSSAWGAGPAMQARYQIAQRGTLGLWWQLNGALLFYNNEFPRGGDRYNFMWRTGPAIHWQMSERTTLAVQYQWMHVSNGQGTGDHNPGYDGHGLSIGVIRSW